MIALFILSILSVVLFFVYSYRLFHKRHKNFPPGPPRLPLWGSYWYLLKEDYQLLYLGMEKYAKQYKSNILGFYFGDTPLVVTMDYELSKELLTREEFQGRNESMINRTRGLGKLLGIFFVDEDYWREQRRFSLRHLRDYGFGRRYTRTEEHFEEELKDLIQIFQSEPREHDLDVCRRKGEVHLPTVFYGPMMNGILQMLVGKRFEHHKLRPVAHAALRFLRSGDATGNAIGITPWLRFISADYFGYTSAVEDNKVLRVFMEEQVKEHKTNLSDELLRDFADYYLNELKIMEEDHEVNPTFSEEQLVYLLMDYMFPAPVAVGNTLNYLWCYLLMQPEIQTKVQEEIDQVVGRGRLPNLDDRKNLPYTDAVIREIIRKEPITPLGVARRAREDTMLGGYYIPKDSICIASIYGAHHDTSLWKDPHSFIPERHLDKNGKLDKKDRTIGFGAGRRLCAGETFARNSLFLVTAALLQNFTFKIPKGEKMPNPYKKISGILTSTHPMWVEAVSR